MAILAKSTAHNRAFLMVQTADHISALTGATVTVALSKNGGSFATAGGAVTEIANGWYYVALNTTDTGTAGDLAFHCTATSGDPTDFCDQVVDPTVVTLGANVVQISGNSTAASQVSQANQAIGRGTCTTGGSTTSIPTSAWNLGGVSVVSGQFIGRTIIFDAGTATGALAGQATAITNNTSGATPTFTVVAMTTAPASGDTFSVV